MIRKLIGILGGTFDPIHIGHIQSALETYQQLPMQTIFFVPCKQPVHKTFTMATQRQRATMIQLAICPYPELQLDMRELQRSTPSYTITTLRSFRKEYPKKPLCFIVGIDAFNQFESWQQWQHIFELTHIILIERPGEHLNLSKNLQLELANRLVTDKTKLYEQSAGSILKLRLTPHPISATQIRTSIAENKDISRLVPATVHDYIKQHKIYS